MSERPPQSPSVITFVCTGNAARSVMAACLLRDRLSGHSGFEIRSAGTLVLPGQPMSVRTRTALERHGLRDHSHRSRQFTAADADASDLVLVMEPDHAAWMRREFPEALGITGALKRVARELAAAHGPDLATRVAALRLAEHGMQAADEVVDPGAGDQADFDACIDELAGLIDDLAAALRHPVGQPGAGC